MFVTVCDRHPIKLAMCSQHNSGAKHRSIVIGGALVTPYTVILNSCQGRLLFCINHTHTKRLAAQEAMQ